MTSEDQGVPRGPGFWKFNNSLLENEEFVTKLKFLILTAKEKYREVIDKRLFWEMIKMEIRTFSIRFAKRKAKEKREMEFELLRKLQDLNARIDAAPERSPLANEAKKIKIKLGIPIDRVPTSKSCVFCLGIKFLFFPFDRFLVSSCYKDYFLEKFSDSVALQTCYIKV